MSNVKPFIPGIWHWFVTDVGRYWSPEAIAYTDDAPAQYNTVVDEAELYAVLSSYGLANRAPAQPVSEAAINAERDRRIGLGASVTVGGNTFTVQTRHDVDFRNINGLVSKGIVMTMAGDTQTTIGFRDADNNLQQLTAAQLIDIGNQVAAHVSAIYTKSWALKAMSPIPADYTADAYWS